MPHFSIKLFGNLMQRALLSFAHTNIVDSASKIATAH